MRGYFTVIQDHYFDYADRAGRREFWHFALTHLVITFAISSVEASIGNGEVAGSMYLLFAYIPAITVTIRRLHDTGRGGFWQLLGLVPLVGTVILIAPLSQRGSSDRNQYDLPLHEIRDRAHCK